MQDSRTSAVREFLGAFQQQLCRNFGDEETAGAFVQDAWRRDPADGKLAGDGITAVLEGGNVLERAGVALSDVSGTRLPPAATARNPHLAGQGFRAMGVSCVVHPRNPNAPTAHMNVRYFSAGEVWWFGGGFDLTPYRVFEADAVVWHRAAAAACAPFHPRLYRQLRTHCDEYFFLPHRGEARGLGGIFFDDLNDGLPEFGMPWERCFEFLQQVGAQFLQSYVHILRERKHLPYGERERRYQLYRRGRYVEFNLVIDRGTLFGLQSGGRTESILMSMPPTANWSYGSPDPELDAQLLPYLTTQRGRDWLASS